MSNTTLIKRIWLARVDLNVAFALAICSLCFCWLYGIPPLIAGYVALKNLISLKSEVKSDKRSNAFKMKWGLFIAWAGIGFSLVFTVLYMVALITGAYIRI